MSVKKMASVAGVFAALGGGSSGQLPAIVGPMEHLLISYDGSSLSVSLDPNADPSANVLDDQDGAVYDGNASVLSGRMINDQYGWLANGFIQLGSGEGIWVEALSVSDGLDVYEGGMRPMLANHSYSAILGTEGSSGLWQWSGTMTHNWYAADEAGLYEATYRVFVGDAVTGADLGIASDTVTLSFVAIPAPASAALVGLGLFGIARRR
ncbi:MAG: PEP-CTERM sorting domain-containing protein [Planctomycetota bacterium]